MFSRKGHFVSIVCRPVIELCIPSVLDPTLAPKGCHVASLFTQFTPYSLSTGPWTEQDKEAYANTGQYTYVASTYMYKINFISIYSV